MPQIELDGEFAARLWKVIPPWKLAVQAAPGVIVVHDVLQHGGPAISESYDVYYDRAKWRRLEVPDNEEGLDRDTSIGTLYGGYPDTSPTSYKRDFFEAAAHARHRLHPISGEEWYEFLILVPPVERD